MNFTRRHLVNLATVALTTWTLSARAEEPAATPSEPDAEEDVVFAPQVDVIDSRSGLEATPGAGQVVDDRALKRSRPFTINEALRKVPGVHARDEEGFGLRPNIGLRGLNPTRSTKVLLLEDGIPLAYAPYGDNASYYHPPVERYERIEVLKGSGQILFGPHTVGGVVNYVTPTFRSAPGGFVSVTAGTREQLAGHLRYGGSWGDKGLHLDLQRKQGSGSRRNTHSVLHDASLKTFMLLGERQGLTLRFSHYDEVSQNTYSGLTQAEWDADPRQNPFANDWMYASRQGASVTHDLELSRAVTLTTNVYGSLFDRRWWRQSSNSNQRPNDASDPLCGGMDNLNTTCGNQGRLRQYRTMGIEPRVKASYELHPVRGELEAGLRLHVERQDRLQLNGDLPWSRSVGTSENAGLVEHNLRKNQALAGFLQNRFLVGPFSYTPGVRVEHIRYQRSNRLTDVRGETELTVLIPGMGATWEPTRRTTVFAGIHRGFAPPRTEDVISNGTGATVDLDPELSWNSELGVRSESLRGLSLEATAFRMDFRNQIVPASVAGGSGATLTNAGRTLHQGVELSVSAEGDRLAKLGAHNPYTTIAYTFLFDAEFVGRRTSSIPGFETVSVTGNRLPYAPEHLLTVGLGYAHAVGFDARLEAVYVGKQFADDLNTSAPSPDGQRGLIDGHAIFNATAGYTWQQVSTTAFLSVKNLADTLYVADRTRGLLPGTPRLVLAGLRYEL